MTIDKINNGFADYYYITPEGKVYNKNTNKYLKLDIHRYRLMTKEGKVKSIQLKELYKMVYGKVYCKDNIKNQKGEIWKEIADTEGNYLVSNKGRVKSYCAYEAKLLIPQENESGYQRVQIVQEGICLNKFIHCLVASAFEEDCGKPKDNNWQVHHKNFITKDNRSINLQWVSLAEHRKIHNKILEKENVENVKIS